MNNPEPVPLPPQPERIQRTGRALLDVLNRNATWPCACCGQVSGHSLKSACGALAHELAMAAQAEPVPLPPVEALIEQARVYACDSDLKPCRRNWPDDPASWCEGCLLQGLAERLEAALAAIPSPQTWQTGEPVNPAYAAKDARFKDAEVVEMRRMAATGVSPDDFLNELDLIASDDLSPGLEVYPKAARIIRALTEERDFLQAHVDSITKVFGEQLAEARAAHQGIKEAAQKILDEYGPPSDYGWPAQPWWEALEKALASRPQEGEQ